MAHVQLEFDAIGKAHGVASLVALPPQHVTGGLCELWAFCWREKTDVASRVVIEGIFGSSHPRLIEALVGFGFLAEEPDGLRVRGASKYLRVAESIDAGRRKGGLAAKKNLRQYSGSPPADHRLTSRLKPASTPNTEHRTPNTEIEAKSTDSSSKLDPPPPEQQVFEHWAKTLNHPRAVLDEKRRKLIREQLKLGPVEELCQAVNGVLVDIQAWPERRRFDGIDYVFANRASVEKFLDLALKGNPRAQRHDRFQASPDPPPMPTMEEIERLAVEKYGPLPDHA